MVVPIIVVLLNHDYVGHAPLPWTSPAREAGDAGHAVFVDASLELCDAGADDVLVQPSIPSDLEVSLWVSLGKVCRHRSRQPKQLELEEEDEAQSYWWPWSRLISGCQVTR
eukprot:gnl/TRDRNA2_/TRDRNA2_49885_c0_seq2.p1 gnl/TRDRNA2_/TRDRNA2_49885_c0~~gnl/TRDRNA2_/TRDRNA2_49885_c0_seq2.p1  ORF type:complete len:111 (-),score=20.83 gnl/TRDRNA2_/TRDRNA2_49885_c0_seq2:155-487(-)